MVSITTSWTTSRKLSTIKKCIRNGKLDCLENNMERLSTLELLEIFHGKRRGLDPVHIAAETGNLEALAILFEYGANVDGCTDHGVTPLMLACRYGHDACVALLLGRGASVFTVDQIYNWSSLHYAVVRGKLNCVELILEACKSTCTDGNRSLVSDYVNQRDNQGLSALHVASLSFLAAPVVPLLLREGAFVSPRVRVGIGLGSTPLHFAARSGAISSVLELLLWGANRTAKDCDGRTPFGVALIFGNFECAKILNPSLPEPLIWPTPERCILMRNLNGNVRKLLRAAYDSANENRKKGSTSHRLSLSSIFKRRSAKRTKGSFLEETESKPEPTKRAEGEDSLDSLCDICFTSKPEVSLENCGHLLCAGCIVSMCCRLKPVRAHEEPRTIQCPFCRGTVVGLALNQGT